VTATNAPSRPRPSWARFRGVLAAGATVLLVGGAVVAPFAVPQAVADQEFYERIHQEFVPDPADFEPFELEIAPLEKLPEPEPVVEPEPAQVAAVAVAAAPPKYTGGGSPAEWMAAAGIPESEWGYVDAIVSRESGWNPNATNASSGACGLVQALPCTKVPGGNGYDPVANLVWGNGYAHGRYGSWAQAYDFWQANHWW
jgi:soluble lytic murein transglycosylase-like protein